ncbi:MAG: baseplate J/gp47 family protein [Clostridium sp.]|nr:baseplate J/gp47 family protein [Clostridium sp.]
MIPEIVLDTEQFQEIFEEARGKIASIYPDWNDYNYHDPGITMLELFAWLKEGQQFYMDQTSEAQMEKFLKLMGTKRLEKEPAKAVLTVDATEDILLPRRTKFYADTICYEAVEQNYLLKEDIIKCFCGNKKIEEYMDRRQLKFGHQIKMYMFGKEAEKGESFYIGLQEALPVGVEISVYFDVFQEYEVVRNPLTKNLSRAFAKYAVEYLSAEGWQEVKELRDTTFGFLQDGQIFFKLQSEMAFGHALGEEGYFLRIRLLEAAYDIPPVLTDFGINVLNVEQTEHVVEHVRTKEFSIMEDGRIKVEGDTFLSIYGDNDIYIRIHDKWYEAPFLQKYLHEESLTCSFLASLPESARKSLAQRENEAEEGGIHRIQEVCLVNYERNERNLKRFADGNGYPNQNYKLYEEGLIPQDFAIMVLEEPGVFQFWEQVDDFALSGPEDRHYVLDSREGILKFGDCMHGMPPEGEIRIVEYARSYGASGRTKANQINQLTPLITKPVVVTNKKESVGGRNEESFQDSFLRVQREWKRPLTAVTYEDYERYIKETPGLMIASCKVLKPQQVKELFPYYEESSISVVLKPYTKLLHKNLMEIYRDNILSYLEQYRMAGTSVYLIRPDYIGFELFLEVVVKANYVNGKEEIKQTVEKHFKKLGEGFGGCVRYSQLYGVIDRLPCVKQIHALSFTVRGSGVKHLLDGSIQVPPNGVVELCHADYQFAID